MKEFLNKYKNVIFSSITAGLTISSLVSMNKAAVKYYTSEDDSMKNKLKCYWKPAILGALSVAGSIYTGMEADRMNSLYLAAIAYINEYRSNVAKTYGVSAERGIREKIQNDDLKNFCFEDLTFPVEDEHFRLFYIKYPKDEFTGEIVGKYFYSTLQNVLNAQYLLNMNYATIGKIYLYDLFSYLNIESNDYSFDTRGWNMIEDGYPWIEFANYVERMEDGLEVCVIEIKTIPTEIIDQ